MKGIDITKAMSDELYSVIEKHNSGLYILDPPTGSSKSHSMYLAIARYLVDTNLQGRPIFFLTPQKKNLNDRKQRNMYVSFFPDSPETAGKRFDAVFQWLDNKDFYLERILKNKKNNILAEIPPEIQELEEFKSLQNVLEQQEEMRNLKIISESLKASQEKVYQTAVSQAEALFRSTLRETLEERYGIKLSGTLSGDKKDNGNLDGSTLRQSIQLLKEKEPWIEKLYPGTFLLDKKLIFMSFDKFCYGNVSLLTALHDFWSLYDGQNPIMVIDELDSTHDACEKFILKQSLSHTDDLIQVFDTLRRRLENPKNLPKHITALESIQTGRYSMKTLFKEADSIYQKYHLNLELKFEGPAGASLFSSFYYYTTGRSFSYIEYEKERNNMLIHIVNHNEYRAYLKRYEGKEDQRLFPTWLVKALWRFVTRFRKCLFQWALEYKKNIDERALKKFQQEKAIATNRRTVYHPNALLLDDACRSILDALRIGVRSQQDILMPKLEQMQPKSRKKSPNEDWLDTLKNFMPLHPYFSSGYALTNLYNTTSHCERTEIRFFFKPYAAEGFLSLLAKHFMVIGLSATARVPNLSNYYLPYLIETLGDSFYPMSDKLHQALQMFYQSLVASYQKNQIQMHIKQMLDPTQNYVVPDYLDGDALETLLGRFYTNEVTQGNLRKEIQELLQNYTEKDSAYAMRRYMEMLDGIWQFYHAPTSHAWLFLNTLLPEDKPQFNEGLLKHFIEGFDKEFPNRKASFFVLRSKDKNGTSFEITRNAIRQKLKEGEDVIVFSAYNSIGVGIDLDYESAYHPDDYVDVYPDDPHYLEDSRHKRRDFDGFVFGDITYLMDNVAEFSQEKDPYEKEMRRHRFISSLLALEEMAQINYSEGNQAIQDILETKSHYLKLAQALREFRTRPYVAGQVQYKLIQALGRGNRAFCKNRNIHILVSTENLGHLLRAEPEPEEIIHTPEWAALLQFARQYESEGDREVRLQEQTRRIAINRCYCEESALKSLLSFSFTKDMVWDKVKRDCYELLGRFVMCFPTYDDIETVIQKMNLDEDESALVRHFHNAYLDFGRRVNFYEYLRWRKTNQIYPYCEKDKDKIAVMRELKLDVNYHGDYTRSVVSAMEARLYFLFHHVPGLKDYFKKMGYATNFKMARYIMCPTLFTNFYKGRLGEIVGTYILKQCGIEVNPITNNEYYEVFDAKIGDGQSLIDFKNWKLITGMYFVNQSNFYNKVQEKLERIRSIDPTKAKHAYIIRICQTDDDDELLDKRSLPTAQESIGQDIITVLNLVDNNGINLKAIELIKELEKKK